ncbi:hypothetical protein [Mameliella sediminis]|uniref:hypothetical protein n=1 Tax=Mameliella sediminis TaxID=2836866 RepID=UPI001C48208E|nr:hypothetical protein [Mameliella sediminis]MBV7395185.1 hypothetical protein [Mameliella sediminis]
MNSLVSMRAVAALFFTAVLTGCAADVRGPSVPFQAGANLEGARAAFDACSLQAQKAGQSSLAGHYVGSVLWGGLVVGPIVVASNAPNLRYNGEINAMDRCMENRGFVRRDLTPAELRAVQRADAVTRRMLLDHLVGGGTLESFHRA